MTRGAWSGFTNQSRMTESLSAAEAETTQSIIAIEKSTAVPTARASRRARTEAHASPRALRRPRRQVLGDEVDDRPKQHRHGGEQEHRCEDDVDLRPAVRLQHGVAEARGGADPLAEQGSGRRVDGG